MENETYVWLFSKINMVLSMSVELPYVNDSLQISNMIRYCDLQDSLYNEDCMDALDSYQIWWSRKVKMRDKDVENDVTGERTACQVIRSKY